LCAQVVAGASQSAAAAESVVHGKARAAAAAQDALEAAGDEAQRLAVRASTLIAQLAHERQSKKVSHGACVAMHACVPQEHI
jgi:hypothetical protein